MSEFSRISHTFFGSSSKKKIPLTIFMQREAELAFCFLAAIFPNEFARCIPRATRRSQVTPNK